MSAKMRMVTRTVKANLFEVMTVNTETKEVSNVEIAVSAMLDTKATEKAIRKAVEIDTIKVVMWTAKGVNEVLYGMPEEDFIRLARVLPPRSSNDNTDE